MKDHPKAHADHRAEPGCYSHKYLWSTVGKGWNLQQESYRLRPAEVFAEHTHLSSRMDEFGTVCRVYRRRSESCWGSPQFRAFAEPPAALRVVSSIRGYFWSQAANSARPLLHSVRHFEAEPAAHLPRSRSRSRRRVGARKGKCWNAALASSFEQ